MVSGLHGLYLVSLSDFYNTILDVTNKIYIMPSFHGHKRMPSCFIISTVVKISREYTGYGISF